MAATKGKVISFSFKREALWIWVFSLVPLVIGLVAALIFWLSR